MKNNFNNFWKTNGIEKNEKFEMMDTVKEIVQDMDMGNDLHSEEWNMCVRNVQLDNVDIDANAWCTQQLGEESFKAIESMNKSELKQAMAELKKAIDIEDAGPTPYSLLAVQDMENRKKRFVESRDTEKDRRGDDGVQAKTEPIDMGKPKPISNEEAINIACEMVDKFYDYVTIVACLVDEHGVNQLIANEIVRVLMTEDEEMSKDAMQATSKKLEEFPEEAEEVSNEEEKSTLVDKMKATQIKRQKAVINARKGIFKEGWKNQYEKTGYRDAINRKIEMWRKKIIEAKNMASKETSYLYQQDWLRSVKEYEEHIKDLQDEMRRE